jgi:pimeloyl-ACP methyl ester carboxylesterase
MDELKALHRGEKDLKPYGSAQGVAQRLMKTNRRLGRDKAEWLAARWARPDGEGQWRILGEPAHKVINAQLYRVDEALEIFKAIAAPTLAVEASEDSLSLWAKGKFTLAEYHERLKCVRGVRTAVIQDSGHMLHHDQPEALARLVEDFLDG